MDPSLTEGELLWNGYGNLNPPPSILEKRRSMPTSTSSFYETFLSRAMTTGLEGRGFGHSEPESITIPLYSIILGQWLLALEYTFTGLFQVEWHIDASRAYEPQDPSRQRGPQELDNCLQKLHKWQRRLPFFTSWLQSTVTSLEGCYLAPHKERLQQSDGFNLSQNAACEPWTELISDFQSIHIRFAALASRADKILNIATAITSIQENKRVMEQSQSLSRITYLAFIFIPLSFVSSFLSMNGDFENQSQAYARFFEIATPLSLMAFGLAIFGRHIQTIWRAAKEAWKKGDHFLHGRS